MENGMNRRAFLSHLPVYSAGLCLPALGGWSTKHLIFIVNGAARKKDYYENPSIARNVRRLAGEGFVFEEDHCEQVASHEAAFAALVEGLPAFSYTDSLRTVTQLMHRVRPRILVCREMSPDVGHESFEAYLAAVRSTDDAIGGILDWVKGHPYFSQNTTVVV